MYPCTNCQTTKSTGQWWNLRGYFGINGRFCQACYAKVSHDSYGKPGNLKEYLPILQKQEKPYA